MQKVFINFFSAQTKHSHVVVGPLRKKGPTSCFSMNMQGFCCSKLTSFIIIFCSRSDLGGAPKGNLLLLCIFTVGPRPHGDNFSHLAPRIAMMPSFFFSFSRVLGLLLEEQSKLSEKTSLQVYVTVTSNIL